ncbi:TIGR01244 family sulfur transferase [Allopontixanthobacter confluentis]|nr:TIGR01244 family sulfur transferase [Allopontixanthobacter confluentis]
MMELNQITPDFAATGQLGVDDLAQAAALGFRTIVDNRPDGEAPDMPSSAEMEAAAHKLGLGFAYIPIVPGQLSDHEALELRQVLATMQGPVLGYCRSGARTASLWQKYCELPAEPPLIGD